MTASLNGQLLNGSIPYATWAWGWARAEATATGEAYNKNYSDAVATATATASVIGSSERNAYLDGEEVAFADASITSTRYAYLNSTVEGAVQDAIQPIRTAWFNAPALEPQVEAAGTAERWKILTASAEAESDAPIENTSVTIYRKVFGKNIPAQAMTWIAESRIEEIQVRQLYLKADAKPRALSRALANTALGFSDIYPEAEVASDYLKVNTYHSFTGSSVGELHASVDSSRIRIIVGAMQCYATAKAEPTITTSEGRFSYNSGLLTANAHDITRNQIHRRPGYSKAYAETVNVPGVTYLRRGVYGSSIAVAMPDISLRNNSWQYAKGKAESFAELDTEWQHYRWRTIAGKGEARAEVIASNLHYRPTSIGSFVNEADSTATMHAIRPMKHASEDAYSDSQSTNSRAAYAVDDSRAEAGVAIEAYGRRGRIMTGLFDADAWSEATGLREVWTDDRVSEGVGSVLKFIYRVNVDALAPDSRSILLPHTERELLLPPSDREYRIQ